MKKALFLLLLMYVPVVFAMQKDKYTVPLTIEGDRSHVTVRIGDLLIPRILIDSGFAYDGLIIYNPDFRDLLDLTKAMEVKIGGAGSGEASTALMIDSTDIFLDDIRMENQRIIVLQGEACRGFASNGIIGYSILGHYITQFDYDRNEMTLHDQNDIAADASWTMVPLYFKDNNIPWLDISVSVREGPPIRLSAYIDYAASDPILLLEKPEMKFQYPSDTAAVYIGRGLSGDIFGKEGTIARLLIGPHVLNNVKTYFAPAEVRSKQKNADAILGIGSLRRFNQIFDYANKKLYLKPNAHFDEPYQ